MFNPMTINLPKVVKPGFCNKQCQDYFTIWKVMSDPDNNSKIIYWTAEGNADLKEHLPKTCSAMKTLHVLHINVKVPVIFLAILENYVESSDEALLVLADLIGGYIRAYDEVNKRPFTLTYYVWEYAYQNIQHLENGLVDYMNEMRKWRTIIEKTSDAYSPVWRHSNWWRYTIMRYSR